MKLLVPTAGPEPARENAAYICDIAKKFKAHVVALHIRDMGEETEGKEAIKIFQSAAKKAGVKVKGVLLEGNIVPAIVDTAVAEQVDLIIMGASPGRAMADWIVTDVLDKCQVPVVIIPYRLGR